MNPSIEYCNVHKQDQRGYIWPLKKYLFQMAPGTEYFNVHNQQQRGYIVPLDIRSFWIKYIFFLLTSFLFVIYAGAQQINLDKPVKADELTLFPDISNELVYYYVSDKPKLSRDGNGRPQFSFLRFADNQLSDAAGPAASEGDGGGIVHAVVSLSVTPDQLRNAQRALQRIKPNAIIQGPVVFKSGRFGIVSSFKDPAGGLIKQVVGLGAAPILDGQKAAVSIQLNKQGAKILWESFKTATPDISFTFEMEVTGYRSPKKAIIEASFDQVYNHQAFAAGFASQYLAAEIRGAFDDLVRSGAIKLTQVGEDEKMEALISTAYNKIADMMFAPLNGTGSPSLGDIGVGQNQSMLDKATQMLRQNRTEAREINREEEARRTTGGGSSGGGTSVAEPPRTADTSSSGIPPDARTGAGRTPYEPSRAARDRGIQPPSETPDRSGNGGDNNSSGADIPSFSIVASFEMKRVRQQGIFRIDLNKATSDKIDMRFDENIGDLTAFMNDVNIFRQVNLDDPLFVQREIVAFIDGMNAQDFGQYVNYVNVRMKKTHATGDITTREVRIDRNNFTKEANNFRMIYGWKNDADRSKWLDYEYETEWSFFGGQSVIVPAQKSKSGAINLMPPFQRRTVEFQADPATVTANNIRLITVKLTYNVDGREQTKIVTLNPAKNHLSEKAEFILPPDSFGYQYEVSWKLANNQTRTSGKLNGEDSIVFVDNISNG